VVKIYTYQNRPTLYLPSGKQKEKVNAGEELLALSSDEIKYEGQDIAFVIAETYEQAREAAGAVRATYAAEKPVASIDDAVLYAPEKVDGEKPHLDKKSLLTPSVESAWNASDAKIDVTYETPSIHHHPMEPHSVVAKWEGDHVTCYTPTQWMIGTRNYLRDGLGVSEDKIRVVSHYLGGGFGCKGSSWMFILLTAMAARDLGRPVKFVLEREQMFTSNGYRPATTQRLWLGAKKDGTLSAMRHYSATSVSEVGEFLEATGHRATYTLYESPAIEIDHRVYALNAGAPIQMRAPGESPGVYALESAMDELAVALQMDPLELRRKNMAAKHPFTGLAWSSKHLDDCYQVAADSFGWSKRNPQPGLTRDGDWLVGSGMATALYPANRLPASARVRILHDGTAVVSSATHDLGTGMYTIMAQMAGQQLGLPVEKIRVELGDSTAPSCPPCRRPPSRL
jgi:xanthine dehydrogenase YagR molybdenum-binding subunit